MRIYLVIFCLFLSTTENMHLFVLILTLETEIIWKIQNIITKKKIQSKKINPTDLPKHCKTIFSFKWWKIIIFYAIKYSFWNLLYFFSSSSSFSLRLFRDAFHFYISVTLFIVYASQCHLRILDTHAKRKLNKTEILNNKCCVFGMIFITATIWKLLHEKLLRVINSFGLHYKLPKK